MHVKIAANILGLDEVRQLALGCGFHFAPIFAQHGWDIRQSELFEDVPFFGPREALLARIE